MKLSTIPSILVSLVSLSLSVQAVPISHSNYALVHAKRQDRTQVTRQQIDDTLRRPALFSRVAYCSAESITSWNCGAPCEALGEVEVFLAGGDDGAIPGFFVAHDKTSNSIIVAHQGTERDNVLSVINNLQLRLIEPNATLFPSTVGSNIRVHEGFHATFQRTSDSILSTILTTAIPRTGATRIVSTGHSLGGAVAVFDGMMIKEAVKDLRVVPLGPDGNPVSGEGEEGGQGVEIQVETRVFGNPRTGNEEWANWIDSTARSLPPLFFYCVF
ncbi:hypothetical protein AX16_004732 [Volvariella volvacea WC 439]|nr:hypothetical protein AX16_004732 [Volvariella volvacea WC 439]